jgi:hypothetical protein
MLDVSSRAALTPDTPTVSPAPPAGLRLAVVGSRDFDDLDRVRRFIRTLPASVIVVSGGARGVDRTAVSTARARGLRFLEHLADWERDGIHEAGRLRNEHLVRDCHRMVAFWDGKSTGTHDAIDRARRYRRPLTIYRLRHAPLVGRLAGRPVLETVDGTARAQLDLVADWPASGGGRVTRTYHVLAAGDLATALARLKPGRRLRIRATLRQLFYTDAAGLLCHRAPAIEARSFKLLPSPRPTGAQADALPHARR